MRLRKMYFISLLAILAFFLTVSVLSDSDMAEMFLFEAQSSASDANSSANDAYGYAKKAYYADSLEDAQYYAKKAMRAAEEAEASASAAEDAVNGALMEIM